MHNDQTLEIKAKVLNSFNGFFPLTFFSSETSAFGKTRGLILRRLSRAYFLFDTKRFSCF